MCVFPWPTLYFASTETVQIKEIRRPSVQSGFLKPPRLREEGLDAEEGVKCLCTHLKQAAVPLGGVGGGGGVGFYDRRGGRRRKDERREGDRGR